MPIHIDVLAEINRREMSRQADQLADDWERAGRHAGDEYTAGFAEGVDRGNPKIVSAMDKAAAATNRVTSAQAAYTRVANDNKATDEQLFNAKSRLTAAMTAEIQAWNGVTGAMAKARAESDASGASWNEARKTAESLSIAQEKLRKVIEDSQGEAMKLNKSYMDIDDSLTKLRDGTRKYADESENVIRSSARMAEATTRSGQALRTVEREFADIKTGLSVLGDGFKEMANTVTESGETLFHVARGAFTLAIVPLIDLAWELGGVVVTASQSLLLLPAAAAAAGAGLGTLKLATMGFDQALKDIKDPKKFAHDLADLSPAAQQAALAIREIFPELEALQRATQEDFMAGFSDKINQLSTTYLPTIQGLTTNIATSFNKMLTDISNTLMTPANQGSISTIADNIGQAFQNAAPAAKDFSQAILDITAAGSSFLPELGNDIANAANEFANFISEARQSGQLQVWIQEGIDALTSLKDSLASVGGLIFDTFGGKNKDTVEDFSTQIALVAQVIGALTGDTDSLKGIWQEVVDGMITSINHLTGPLATVRDFISDIPRYLVEAGKGFVDFANVIIQALNQPIQLLNKIDEFLNKIAGWTGMKPDMPTGMTGIPSIHNSFDDALKDPNNAWQRPGWQQEDLPYRDPSQEGGSGYDRIDSPTTKDQANQQYSGLPGNNDPTANKTWTDPSTGKVMVGTKFGWLPADDPRAQNPGNAPGKGPYDVPPDPGKGTASQKSQLDSIKAGLDPSAYAVDPYAAVTGLPAVGGVPGAAGTMLPGQAGVHGQQMLEANEAILKAAHTLEEDKKDLLAKQKDANSTQEDIQKAQWKITEDGWALQKAQADMAQKATGTAKATKKGVDDLAAALDPDLGLSKGLSGLADNLVRFLGDVLFAPEKAKLQAQIDADPIKGGFGLLGVRGAQNEAQGLSPLLGNPMPPGTYGPGGGYGAPGYGAGSGQGSYGGYGQYGSLPGPSGGGSSYPAVSAGAGGTLSPSQQQVASSIIAAGQALGKSPAEITAGLNVAKLESNYGANPLSRVQQNQSGTIVQGIFQQDLGYTGDHNDPYNSATQFFQRMGQRAQPGQSPGQEAVNVQVGQYGAGYVDSQGQQGTYAALAPGANSGFVTPGGAAVPGGNPWVAGYGVPQGGNNAAPGGSGPYLPPTSPGAGTTTDYTAPLPGNGMSWVPGKGWVTTGVGAPLGTRPSDQPYGSGASFDGGTGLPAGVGGSNSWKPTAGAGGPAAGPTQIGDLAPSQGHGGGGGIGITPGGSLDTAISAAASILPGGGAAAQTGMKLASRAIQFGGQAAGIGVQGALDTFLPTGGSALAQNSWLTRILGGLAGATPAIPGNAGGKNGNGTSGDIQGPLTPQQAIAQHLGNGTGSPGQQNNIVINNHDSSADQTGKQVEYHVSAGYPPPAGTP